MKCFYYLSPTLASAEHISDDLHQSGVSDWFIHIISRNEAGLNRKHLHSSNYLETLDIIRDGLIGAVCGFFAGLIFAGGIATFEPFGPEIPMLVYVGVVFLLTCFGAWQGGLVGISSENKKLERFHDEIATGKYLILVYAHKNEEENIRNMMSRLHPEARLVGFDARFYNPFSTPTTL
ncbi:MAG: hypothetical protein RQ899_05200 [Pseudomonadales bacterium]|nr:hypothetical protein [Pseudomonadales bacterium]